jgi:poly-gamma-glutamate system protein
MKRMYWRPQRVSRTVLVLISIVSIGGFAAVESFKRKVRQPYYSEKIAAAKIAQNAFKALQDERIKRKLPIDKVSDPAQSGLIGDQITPVTTNLGSLIAKQTALNPNFAAVVVEYLRRAGVQSGDTVGVGYSGSFPGINVNVLAAMEALKLKPIIISSAASSKWGANLPEFLWLDMEKTLNERGIITARSIAGSIGGIEDKGLGMTKKGRTILEEAITKAGIKFVSPLDFADSIEQRMAIYRELAGDRPIKAYINVGGGTTSVGTKAGKRSYKAGVNRSLPQGWEYHDSVMSRFIQEGVPVIHMTRIAEQARRYGLPIQPRTIPPVGSGEIFYRDQYNLWLAGGLLALILGSLYAFVRSDLGFRIMARSKPAKTAGHPEPMV